MHLVAWPGKHNEPGFAGGGVHTDYLIDLVTRFINWQMIGAILFYSWPGYSCHNGFALPFLGCHSAMAERTYPGGTKFLLVPAGQPTTTVTTTGGNAAATVRRRVAHR